MAKTEEILWSNINYNEDLMHALMWCRWIMRVLGLWPLVYPTVSRMEKFQAMLSFALCCSALGYLLIPMFIYTLSSQTVTREKVKMLGPLSYALVSILKYLCLIFRTQAIGRCIGYLNFDWRTVQCDDYRRIMLKNAAKGHMLSKICIVFMYCGGMSYHMVMPFLAQTPDYLLNVTARPIPYPGYDFFWNLDVNAVYVTVFGAQFVGGVVMFNVTTAVCSLAATFVTHACGQIEIVLTRVENLTKHTAGPEAKAVQSIAEIVRHHVHVLRFSANVEDTLREVFLFDVVGSTLIICLLEYYCLTEWKNGDSIAIVTYFFLLLSFVFNAFMFSYISEMLTEQWSKVGHTSYRIEWYRLPQKIMLALTLVIGMSHRPVRLTAGKLINLSFSSFGNVLKTSVAYFNLLRMFL